MSMPQAFLCTYKSFINPGGFSMKISGSSWKSYVNRFYSRKIPHRLSQIFTNELSRKKVTVDDFCLI